jgi:hypothetical protein
MAGSRDWKGEKARRVKRHFGFGSTVPGRPWCRWWALSFSISSFYQRTFQYSSVLNSRGERNSTTRRTYKLQ